MTGRLTPAVLERWRSEPASFIEETLHDPETGRSFKLLPAERAFLEHAFKTADDGRLKYPEQLYACPKKSGKTNEVNERPNPIDFLHKSDATSPMADSSRCGSCTTQRSRATR